MLQGPADLRHLHTFRCAVAAGAIRELASPAELPRLDFDPARDLILGGGSNVLIVDPIPGTVHLVRFRGRRVLAEQAETALVEFSAGENWHECVRWSLEQGLAGLENLSLIPGLAGAAPLQNIGAYGVELREFLDSVLAWDWQRRRQVEFRNQDCGFDYRDSRFKSVEPDRYLLLAIRLSLKRVAFWEPRLDYAGIREDLSAHAVVTPTPLQISDAVIRLRRRKLPDPGVIGNAGSFFKNPLVSLQRAAELRGLHPGLPAWNAGPDSAKLPAAWLIEHCGWKGFRQGDAGVAAQHALVLVNHGQASGRELLQLAQRIMDSVESTFGIRLECEPRVVRHAAQDPAPES